MNTTRSKRKFKCSSGNSFLRFTLDVEISLMVNVVSLRILSLRVSFGDFIFTINRTNLIRMFPKHFKVFFASPLKWNYLIRSKLVSFESLLSLILKHFGFAVEPSSLLSSFNQLVVKCVWYCNSRNILVSRSRSLTPQQTSRALWWIFSPLHRLN